MPEEQHHEIAAKLLAYRLQEMADQVATESVTTANLICQNNGSKNLVSTSIEVIAFLVHVQSRFLPKTGGDYLGDFVYSPLARACARAMGALVSHMQDQGIFSQTVFFEEDITKETLDAIGLRDVEYAKYADLLNREPHIRESALTRAASLISEEAGGSDSTPSISFSSLAILKATVAMQPREVSSQLQTLFTSEFLAYLRRTEVEIHEEKEEKGDSKFKDDEQE